MARGGMPPRPPAGGRGQPPRRGQPPKPGQRPQKPAQQQKQQPKQARQQQGQTQAQKAAQTRHLLEQQRRAAAKEKQQQQQHRLRQAQFLREAHTERRGAEAEELAAQLAAEVSALESILAHGLTRSAAIDLESLYQTPEQPPFDPGPVGTPYPEPVWEDFAPAGGVLVTLGGRAGRQRREAAAREAYELARQEWEAAERARAQRLAEAERSYEIAVREQRERVDQYNSRIARVAAGLRSREPAVVESFLRTVLGRVPLPEGFPRRCEVRHHPATEYVTLRVVLPGPEVVPAVDRYEYVAGLDELRVVHRPEATARELYRSVLAQVVLLVVRDVLEAEPRLSGVTLEGLVDRLHPDSGEPELAGLIEVTADRSAFAGLDLAGTAPEAALGQLDVRWSADPYARKPLVGAGTAQAG